MAALISGTALAAPSFLGITGNILTPDDIVLSPGDFSANLHSFQGDNNPLIIAAEAGVTEGLELGIGSFDPDAPGVDKGPSSTPSMKFLSRLPEYLPSLSALPTSPGNWIRMAIRDSS